MRVMKYESVIDYKEQYRKFFSAAFICVCVGLGTELAIFFISLSQNSRISVWRYFSTYVIMGNLVNFPLLFFADFLCKRAIESGRYRKQCYIFMTSVSLILFNIYWIHQMVPLLSLLALLPVFTSLIYVDKAILKYSYILNLILYTVFIVSIQFVTPLGLPVQTELVDAICTYALLTMVFILALQIIKQQDVIVQGTLAALEKIKRDSLTNLYNHATFYEELDTAIQKHAITKEPFSIILFDLDNFKNVNDIFGHDVGDKVILTLVNTILENIGELDKAFRYGGEELAVICPLAAQEAYALSERIRENYHSAILGNDDGITTSTSAGISEYASELFTGKREFFASADEALYQAKRSGKNKSVVWQNND